ncbi:GTP cyclohydrolase 1 [Geodia barretti]|uniref:GTP cyclohydrolase 1 n=1 Tax=Geodia barretti TaxID=519541 RepID=A0AA35WCA4_GEOBA|nr:GTP cyclohydrolase 1 [Geodia barretti]
MDYEKIQDAIRSVLVAIGEDPHREGLADTPRRIAEMYGELFSGIGKDPASVLTTGFDEGYDETVILRDVPFHSICEHHFLPFFGTAHIAYMPTGRVAGRIQVGARP